jgi:hypothetical protein
MKNNHKATGKHQELYVTIRDEVSDWIIKHGLSKTESKLFFYLLKLDRFGDKPVKVKVAQILLATGISKSAYHAAIAKFESLGWFDFKHIDVTICNLTCISSPRFWTDSPKSWTDSPESWTDSPESWTDGSLKPSSSKGSETPHTIQTYQTCINSLSDSERESFLNFGLEKAKKLPHPPELPNKWIEAHWKEISAEWMKLQGKIPATQNQKWETHPHKNEWIEKIRSLGQFGFYAENRQEEQERREFFKWADANNLIWS